MLQCISSVDWLDFLLNFFYYSRTVSESKLLLHHTFEILGSSLSLQTEVFMIFLSNRTVTQSEPQAFIPSP
jgi:hypothetical protein